MPSAGVDGFAPVDVDVQPSLQDKTVSVNGSYTADQGYYGLSTVTVNVPDIPAVTESLTVSVNNTYYPGQGVDGFSQVIVDVPQSVTGYTEKEITEGYVCIQNLNNSASYVAGNVFAGNTCLETVNLSNASYIGINAFSDCKNLSQVSLPVCGIINSGAFYNCTSLTQVSLPVCRTIFNNAFYSCKSLTQVSLPVCSYISGTTFANTSLSRVYLPMCVYIGAWTFNDCKSLVEADLPVLSTGGGNQVFLERCSSLTTIYLCSETYTLPNYFLSTTNIGVVNSIYTHFDNISRFAVKNGWSSVSSLFIGIGDSDKALLSYSDGVMTGYTKTLDNAFATYLNIDKSSVTSVDLPECHTLLTTTFYGCTALSEVSLPKVQKLCGVNVFNNCTALSVLSFPQLSFIDASTLTGFTNKTVYLNYDGVCYLGAHDNQWGLKSNSYYVPASWVDAYKVAPNWSSLADCIYPIPE